MNKRETVKTKSFHTDYVIKCELTCVFLKPLKLFGLIKVKFKAFVVSVKIIGVWMIYIGIDDANILIENKFTIKPN